MKNLPTASEAASVEDEASSPGRPRLSLVSTRIPDQILDGKDELNFAEFPLSSISDRVDSSVKTLVFEDKIFDKSVNRQIERKVIITGSDAYGLPTAKDEEVLLSLVQLSKLQGFKSKRVYFTRYQLLQILGWNHNGDNYQRLHQSLNRWMGVTLYYKNSWRDRVDARWLDESFHMLERVRVRQSARGKSEPASAEEDEISFFEWNEVVFRSFEKGNVKSLNYDFYLKLESAITKRLYRFLDKRFYHQATIEFDLKNLCYEHIGIARSSPTGDLKRKLNSAVDELETKGYLAPVPKELRFVKEGPGTWKVIFKKQLAKAQPLEEGNDLAEAPSLESRLKEVGIRDRKARELVAAYPEKVILDRLEVLHWMKEHGDARAIANPAGYLIRSIEQEYSAPKQFTAVREKASQESEARKNAEVQRRNDEERARAGEERETARRQSIDKFLLALPANLRSELETEALSKADAGKLKMLQIGGRVAEATRQVIIDAYVENLLSHG